MTHYSWHPQVTDVLITDDGALALTEQELLDLSPLSELVMVMCEHSPQALVALTTACLEHFGEPETGAAGEQVQAALDQMIRAQLVQQVKLP